jgi:hypothetical protein
LSQKIDDPAPSPRLAFAGVCLTLDRSLLEGGTTIRHDATEFMQGTSEVLAYGTAVQLERRV